MLRELPNTKQVEGELLKKWYFCNELDLVVWFGLTGAPCAFQLAYDKYDGEHSISWHHEIGYHHYAVDDGERKAGCFGTPLLYADGPFKRDAVLERFLALSSQLPHSVAVLVAEKLREFNVSI